jgi:hypothetical protein
MVISLALVEYSATRLEGVKQGGTGKQLCFFNPLHTGHLVYQSQLFCIFHQNNQVQPERPEDQY